MNIRQAVNTVKAIFEHNLNCASKGALVGVNDFIVPFFIGDPGVGKTAIPQIAAHELGIPYQQTIVAQYDAGEMAGLPFPMEDGDGNRVATRVRPDYLPTEDVAIWNLDELPQAFLANLNIVSQLVNQWRIGKHHISRGVTIVATGNKPQNRAGTTIIPAHLKDRLMYIPVDPDFDESMSYYIEKGTDFRVRTYLREFPGELHKFNPEADGSPTPRSWEKLGHILKLEIDGVTPIQRLQMISGQIGTEHGEKFEKWIRIESKLPKYQDVIANPTSISVFENPKEASILYMLLANMADRANAKDIGQQAVYVKRLKHADAFAWWYKSVTSQHPELKKHKVITDITISHASQLVGA